MNTESNPPLLHLEHLGHAGLRRTYHSTTQLVQETAQVDEHGREAVERLVREGIAEGKVFVRILAVDEDGSRHVSHVFEPTAAGGDLDLLRSHLRRSVSYDHLDPRGRVLDSTHPAAQCLYLLPDQPVQVGSCWEANLPVHVPLLGRTVDCKFTYRLETIVHKHGSTPGDAPAETSQGPFPRARILFEALPPALDVSEELGEEAHVELAVGGSMDFAVAEGYPLQLTVGVESRSQVGGTHSRTQARTSMVLTPSAN